MSFTPWTLHHMIEKCIVCRINKPSPNTTDKIFDFVRSTLFMIMLSFVQGMISSFGIMPKSWAHAEPALSQKKTPQPNHIPLHE